MKTIIVIELETEFKELKDDKTQENITKDVEIDFHNSIFDMIQKMLEEDDFEEKWLDFLENTEGEYDYLPQEQEMDFNDFGKIKMTISKNE